MNTGRPGYRPPHTGGAVVIGPTPEAFAQRVIDGLRRRLGREPTREDVEAVVTMLDAAGRVLLAGAVFGEGVGR